jgi:hypothetical protein
MRMDVSGKTVRAVFNSEGYAQQLLGKLDGHQLNIARVPMIVSSQMAQQSPQLSSDYGAEALISSAVDHFFNRSNKNRGARPGQNTPDTLDSEMDSYFAAAGGRKRKNFMRSHGDTSSAKPKAISLSDAEAHFLELPAGDRPDTLVVGDLPRLWFDIQGDSSVTPKLKEAFTVFGNVKNIIITNDVSSQESISSAPRSMGENSNSLRFCVVVQYYTLKGTCAAVRSLAQRSLQRTGAQLLVKPKLSIDYDGFFTKHRIRDRTRM